MYERSATVCFLKIQKSENEDGDVISTVPFTVPHPKKRKRKKPPAHGRRAAARSAQQAPARAPSRGKVRWRRSSGDRRELSRGDAQPRRYARAPWRQSRRNKRDC